MKIAQGMGHRIDNAKGAPTMVGEFVEGAVTASYPSDATENAVQAIIVSASHQ